MSFSPIQVFASREFIHYRTVSSPVADIAARFYDFMTSVSPDASHARYVYATAYVGTEPPTDKAFAGSPVDVAVREMLACPPVIVLAQGPMHPWGLFERSSETQSIASGLTSSSATPTSDGRPKVEPAAAIFIPWAVHQVLEEAMENDDEQDASAASFFALACLVHETAHWIAANRRGYLRDPSREATKTSLLPKINFGKAKIATHTRRDWGTHAQELLLGCAFTFMSYADGAHEVVSERIKPLIPKLQPAITPEMIVHFTGNAIPPIVDVSRYGAPQPHEVPKWRQSLSDFLVVSCTSPDFSCHHGACRMRDGTK